MTTKYHKNAIFTILTLFLILGFFDSAFAAASWTSGGPYEGDVRSLAIVNTNPDIIYAAERQALKKSIDGGESWTSIWPGIVYGNFLVIKVSQLPPYTVYAGNWDGLYKSEDGGNTWSLLIGESADVHYDDFKTIEVDPVNPLVLFAGTINYGALFESTDGGETWEMKVSGESYQEGIMSILIDRDNTSNIYAGLQAGPASGINFMRSTDSGENWAGETIGADFQNDVIDLAMTPAGSPSPAIYAVVQNDDVYKSTDGGDSWTSMNVPCNPSTVTVAPDNADVVYIGTPDNGGEIYKSTDGGNTWALKANGLPVGKPTSMVIDTHNSSNVYVGLQGGGLYKTSDGGEHWNPQGLIYGTYIRGLAVDPMSSDTAYASADGEHLAKTTDGGATWDYLFGSPSDLGAVAIDPKNSSNIWVGEDSRNGSVCTGIPPEETCWCNLGLYVYNSKDRGQSWTYSWHSLSSGPSSSWDFGHCFSSVRDILIKPDDSETVLIAMPGFFGNLERTTDDGSTWTYEGGPSTSLAVSPYNTNYMYFGFQSWTYHLHIDRVYVSSDGGVNWGYLSFNETWPNPSAVRDLEVNLEFLGDSGYAPVYAATSLGLMKSAWDGAEWSWEKVSGLPTDEVTAIAIDLATIPGVIYVGTDGMGVFVSKDGGSTWASFNEGLGNLSITKLAISSSHPITLYAGTAGDGVWSTVIESTSTCEYTIAPTSATFDSSGGTGSIAVTTSSGECSWTAQSNDGWITISSGSSGTGNGSVNYAVNANTGTQRTGTIAVAGETFTVTQDAASYTLTVNKAGTGSGVVTSSPGGINCGSDCSEAYPCNTEMALTASPIGDATFIGWTSGSGSASECSGTGQCTIQITEDSSVTAMFESPCSYVINPLKMACSSSSDTGSLSVTATAGCSWTAVSNDPWITITSGSSGSGSKTVGYSVSANTTGQSRTGTITVGGQTFTVMQANAEFADVPSGYWADSFIYQIYIAGITAGCGNSNFCPEISVSRVQMAVFLLKALGEQPAATCTGIFTDVDESTGGNSAFCRYIEKFSTLGITAGCGGTNFCPYDPVTRAQMAVFISKALGEPMATTCSGTFSDVDETTGGNPAFCKFIEKFSTLGITAGCGGGNYCPDIPVSRAQMAVFLTKGFLQ